MSVHASTQRTAFVSSIALYFWIKIEQRHILDVDSFWLRHAWITIFIEGERSGVKCLLSTIDFHRYHGAVVMSIERYNVRAGVEIHLVSCSYRRTIVKLDCENHFKISRGMLLSYLP
jgi:hypothetical protein